VTFLLEVEVLGAVDTPEIYLPYARISVPPGTGTTHHFPTGYAAHWIRLSTDLDCVATALFTYE
jgi:hypothetical protein